jgi:S-formylglutathione hydrolase FrmB
LLGRQLGELAVLPPGPRSHLLLVLLHGWHDPGPLDFLRGKSSGPASLLSNQLFDGLSRLRGKAPAIVLLDGGRHSYFHDRRDGRWGSMILQEAIPDAMRRFGATKVAIGGISMGGYGALHIASLAPQRFCAVGGHSAALWTSGGASAPGAFDDAADYARNDVFRSRARLRRLPVWIDGGDRDPFRDADRMFVERSRGAGVHVTYHVWPGGHDKTYWHAHMAQYLRFYADACS